MSPSESNQQQIFNLIASVIGQKNIIPVPVEFIRFTGDANTAILLNQIIYWTDRTKDPDKWFYKSYDQWYEELALNKYFVSKSITILKSMGLIETKVKKIFNGDTILHYKLTPTIFIEKFGKHLEKRNLTINEHENNDTLQSLGNTNFAFPEVQTLHFPKPKVCISPPLYTETTISQITNERRPPTKVTTEQKQETTQKTKSLVRSFVNNVESLKTTNSEQVEILFNLVPNHKQSELLKKCIAKKLDSGFTPEAIEEALRYTIARSKGDSTNFKSYFGKTLDLDYDEDYKAAKEEKEQEQKKQRKLENDRIEREALKRQNERQEQLKIIAKDEARAKALDSLKSLNPDKYRDIQEQAVEIYKKEYPTLSVNKDGILIKTFMCQILGI